MKRRTFLLSPLALSRRVHAQPPAPSVRIELGSLSPSTPLAGIVFPRAYATCPDAGRSERVLRSGRFAHAVVPGDPALDDLLVPAGADENAGPDTIVVSTVLSGDGGDSPYESSIHVPLVIAWPGRLEPRLAPEILISHVDVMPTVLGLAGVAVPRGAQGRDLSAILLGAGGPIPDSIYAQGRLGASDEWRAVVRGFDKLILNRRRETAGLYNLVEDPAEEHNLAEELTRDSARRSRYQLLHDSMRALALDWMRRTGDGMDPSGLRLRPRL